MKHSMCATCGTQFAPAQDEPICCPICEDERQYIGHNGQKWTSLEQLQADYHNVIRPVEPHLTGIGTHPSFAIGQRALLVQTPQGNLLWDCISLLDDPTIAAVNALGGVDAIAISHPHYYASMVEWSQAFDAPIYLHANDREHVMRPDPAIQFWHGDTYSLFGELTLICAGGHFAGGTVCHWPSGAGGRGALLSGDIVHVVADRRWVTFMYSYPNLIPLPAHQVHRIAQILDAFDFERIYGAWWEKIVAEGGNEVVRRSAQRYIAAIGG